MDLIKKFEQVRSFTLKLTETLETEDFCIQVAPEVSPIKWHLGHTTWFFEELILKKYVTGYNPEHCSYGKIFNSYYKSLGDHWVQAERGKLSRPLVREIIEYRKTVNTLILDLLSTSSSQEIKEMVTLGLHHEQQHQELMLMDIKRTFFVQNQNIHYHSHPLSAPLSGPKDYVLFGTSLGAFGHKGDSFSYDNEIPVHNFYLGPYSLNGCLETNGEYLEFIENQGYSNPEYWHSDGFDFITKNKIESPLYWFKRNGEWYEYTLHGEIPLNLDLPVCHVSFYEAAAYARFKGKRLPTEYEWEHASKKITSQVQDGPLVTNFHPQVGESPLSDLTGQLWQWTTSDYAPYPGHKWQSGPLGEYNSKFMINLKVLRGGSFATPHDHFRNTYRNYFSPEKQWAFTGIRLAGEGYE